MTTFDRDAVLLYDDVTLAGECELDFHKGSGNGGQKRNKTSSAVRVIHRPSGISAVDCSERSQNRNRTAALAKLRMQLALQLRREPAVPPERPECALLHPEYSFWCAHLLDVLAGCDWEPKPAAEICGMTPSALVKKLARDPQLWQYVNAARGERGKGPLQR